MRRLFTLLSIFALGCTTPKLEVAEPQTQIEVRSISKTSDDSSVKEKKQQPEKQKKVQWIRDLDEAVQMSATRVEPVFLVYYSDECDFCDYMMNILFEDDAVANVINKDFVPVSLNITSDPISQDIAASNGIRNVPAIDVVFFTVKMKKDEIDITPHPVARMLGTPSGVDSMLRALNEIKEKSDAKAREIEEQERHEREQRE